MIKICFGQFCLIIDAIIDIILFPRLDQNLYLLSPHFKLTKDLLKVRINFTTLFLFISNMLKENRISSLLLLDLQQEQ